MLLSWPQNPALHFFGNAGSGICLQKTTDSQPSAHCKKLNKPSADSVADPCYVGTDPGPGIFVSDLQDDN